MKAKTTTYLIIATLTGLLMATSACENTKKEDKMNTTEKTNIKEDKTMNSTLFPEGNPLPEAYKAYFTGEAKLLPLLSKDENNEYSMGHVSFNQSARTNWHTHPKGQVLIVTEGIGINQEEGKPAQIIKKGDVVNIPPNVRHWHGGSAESAMSHIAITNFKGDDNVAWQEPVADKDYKKSNTQ